MTHRIRDATTADIPAMVSIEAASFSDPWPASAFESALTMPSATITAAIDRSGTLNGYCVLLTAADEGEIANLAVASNARREGIAALLLGEALRCAKLKNVISVYLEVRASNEVARALYARHNFRPVGRRKGYYQRPLEDALVLQWTDAGRHE